MLPRKGCWFLATALAMFPACGFSIAGDAQADCHRLETTFSALGVRCGGHGIDPAVLRCDEIVISDVTSDDVDECQRWADQVDCASLRSASWQPPAACRLRATRMP